MLQSRGYICRLTSITIYIGNIYYGRSTTQPSMHIIYSVRKVRDSSYRSIYNYTQIEIEHHYKHRERERETEKTNNKTDKHYQ